MEVLHARCAGLDVHRDTVVACARIVEEKSVRHHVEQFGTTTVDLHRLREWLSGHACTHVVMEATGVYWKPVWNVLYGSFELVLANAAHVKNVPGRKTDVNDATWLADLLAHGLVRSSFVPDKPLQELRSLLRTRKQLVREKAQHVQRIEKVLQEANIKLTSCISDIMGQSGRAILQALIDGQTDPDRLLDLTSSRLQAPRAQIREALRGNVSSHHRYLLRLHLEQIGHLEAAIVSLDAEVGRGLDPFRSQVALLKTIPGVSDLMAQVIVSEIGTEHGCGNGHGWTWTAYPRSSIFLTRRRRTWSAEVVITTSAPTSRSLSASANVCTPLEAASEAGSLPRRIPIHCSGMRES